MIYERILAELVSKNCKLTPQRKEILKVLIRAKTPLSAREIFDRLCKNSAGISFDTVYRNLTILKDFHIVNHLDFQDGRGRYELNRHQDHHHHVVCLKCGAAWKIPECPVEHLRTFENGPQNFKVTSHRFELFGYCQNCQE
ncbi:MAG: Fur family transcriptional regulator [Eubacteriales bacterium]